MGEGRKRAVAKLGRAGSAAIKGRPSGRPACFLTVAKPLQFALSPDPMLVFIDESGDPGFKKGSSATFVAALVAFKDHDQARAVDEAIKAAAERLRIHPEFKFSKCRDEVRDAFFMIMRPFDFCVRAIVVQKTAIYSSHLRSKKEAFYAFFVKTMLKFDDGLLKKARIVIDGSGDREFKRQMQAYFRHQLEDGKIESVKFNNSETDRLVQLADMCAGAIARLFKKSRDDRNRWRDMLRPKIEDLWEFK